MPVLDDAAIVEGPDGQGLGIRDDAGGDQDGAEGAAGVEALAEGPLGRGELQRAGGHVVGARVAQHVGQRVRLGDVAACAADHEAQLGLVVAGAVLRGARDVDGGWEGARQGGARLGEEDGRGGQRQVGFLRVVAVVEAQAADEVAFAAVDGREELGGVSLGSEFWGGGEGG